MHKGLTLLRIYFCGQYSRPLKVLFTYAIERTTAIRFIRVGNINNDRFVLKILKKLISNKHNCLRFICYNSVSIK